MNGSNVVKPKVHVYLMPGMAASPLIFEHIQLPEAQFELHRLQWSVPQRGEDLVAYAHRMCKHIKHPEPVLLGVSFGGLLVQEMAKLIPVKKIVLVSSVKCKAELPRKMLFARYTKLYKLLPTGLVNNVELLAKYAFGEAVTKRLDLYEKYLSVRDKGYMDWALDQMLNWSQVQWADNLIHIHGEKDPVFPIDRIQSCIHVPNGTHTMIIHRAKWFNERLPTIILEQGSSY